MRDALVPGERFPDLVLPDHTGNVRRLSELGADESLLLHFFRGWWCPKEQAFLDRLLALQRDAELAYTRFVSVSVDPPEVQAAFRAGLGARWLFLSDAGRTWIDTLGLDEADDEDRRPYVPTTFTLFPDLTIHGRYGGVWYWDRPTAAELTSDFRAIASATRDPEFISRAGGTIGTAP